MNNLKFLIPIIFLFSCGTDNQDDQLLGKYVLTSFEVSDCLNPDDDISFVNEEDGVCAEMDGVKLCFNICFTFTDESFKYDVFVTEDGRSLLNFSTTADFDPTSENLDFCLLEGVECEGVEVSDDYSKITLMGPGSNSACFLTYVLERT